jgi:hypothetical protein
MAFHHAHHLRCGQGWVYPLEHNDVDKLQSQQEQEDLLCPLGGSRPQTSVCHRIVVVFFKAMVKLQLQRETNRNLTPAGARMPAIGVVRKIIVFITLTKNYLYL